ncbi:MAG TPA: S1/P1 Nuclease [Caulobacteraceae bacterium]|nr:S1/P1 Nuclease [Caulobacteraceae bacterium]
MSRQVVVSLAVVVALGAAPPALGWGSSGHRMIGEAAMVALPPELPAFLRTKAAAIAVGEYSREPDRSRGSGRAHDSDRDPGHFVDGDDAGKIGGAVAFYALPATRDDYEAALRAAGASSWKMGYLPYSIIEDWQQLAKDFTYWRVDDAGAKHTSDPEHRAWLEADRARREGQILIDIGLLSHFVGDGSMPLHVSIHYNGWGAFPNPNGYTQDHIHVPWEGPYVRQVVTYPAMQAAMTPFRDCGCPIEQRVGAYLTADLATTVPFYELEKAGAFKPGVVKGVAFTTGRVAAGASELRDEIVLAWRASADGKVGYQPEVAVPDVESGKIDPYDSLYGND